MKKLKEFDKHGEEGDKLEHIPESPELEIEDSMDRDLLRKNEKIICVVP